MYKISQSPLRNSLAGKPLSALSRQRAGLRNDKGEYTLLRNERTVEEGRGKREEGRGKREEGRGKREEGRGKREEGRGKREEEEGITPAK
jgi:hypothetical protein